MTPFEIEVLIHIHVSPSPHADSPAFREAIERFLACGLIELNGSIYLTTERGAAHIRQLCDLPFPVQKWANSHGEIIDVD